MPTKTKTKEPAKLKAGRSGLQIDWTVVDDHLRSHCDGVGIAGILGVSPMTLYRAVKKKFGVNFEAYQQQKRSEGKELLRHKQFQAAMSGDRSMLIWLGKQYLGQSDKTEQTGKDGRPLFPDISDIELQKRVKHLIAVLQDE